MVRLSQNDRLIKFSLSLGVIAVTFTVTIPIPIEASTISVGEFDWNGLAGRGRRLECNFVVLV